MRKKKDTNWETMRSVLGKSVVREDSNASQSLGWFEFQWKLIVGKDLASVTRVDKFSSQCLFIAVSNKSWFPALESLHKKFINEINERAGLILVERIVFREGIIMNSMLKNLSTDENPYLLKKNKIQTPEVSAKDESMGDIVNRISSKLTAILPVVTLVFLSSCTTFPKNQVSQKIDLSNSHAVKAVEKFYREKREGNTKDPRAYYHYLLALQAVRGHQFEKASENLRKLVQFDPNNFEFHRQLVINLIRAGEMEDAYNTLNESIDHFPGNPELSMMMGDILTGRNEFEQALSYYRRVIQTNSGLARAYLLSGSIYEIRQQYNLAEDAYKMVIQVEPMNPLGHHYLARVNILAGKLEDAQKSLSQALELRPNLLQAREFLAWTLESQGKSDEAKKQYKIILKLDPLNESAHKRMSTIQGSTLPMDVDSGKYRIDAKQILGAPDVHLKIGIVYYEQQIYLKALDEFQLLQQKEPKEEISMMLGRIYEILGRLDKAIQEITGLIRSETGFVGLMVYLARLHSMNNHPEKTVELLGEAIKVDQHNDSLYHSIAIAHIAVDQLDEAIGFMQKAITINKDKASYYFELGALQERTGEFELAIKNIKRSIELNPMHSNAHNFLGYIYAIQGKSLDQALGHLNKALSIQPRNGYFLDSLSWIYFKKGESEKALREIKKAMVYTSPDPVLYSHLGDIHFSLMNYLEAGKAWETSLLLTLQKVNDADGELPDPNELEKKIQKAQKFLSNN